MGALRIRKLLISVCLALIFLTGGLWSEEWIQRAHADTWIEISNVSGLNSIRTNLSGHYRLTADINLNGASWAPIGSNTEPFTGILDGNSKIISNLTINNASSSYQGLFSAIGTSGEVRNLGIEYANITAGDYSGILTGTNRGTVTKCYAKGSISGKNYVGGLIGSIDATGRVDNSFTSAFVGGNNYLGGLAGANYGSVSYSYSSSEVAPSLLNNYLQFDGTGYIRIPHHPAYVTDKFTLEAWFQWDPSNIDGDSLDVQFIVGKGYEMFEIHLEGGSGSNGVRFIPIPNSAQDSWLDATNCVQSGWFHVAAVYDYSSDTASMYINGVAQDLWQEGINVGKTASLPRGSNPLVGNITPFSIGSRINGGQPSDYFKGKISDVRFWNKARTAEEIAADRNKTLIGSEPGLIGYWKLNETSGLTAEDLSSNHNNGTLNGGIVHVQEDLATYKGGLIGYNANPDSESVSNSYYNIEVSPDSNNSVGTPYTTLQMKNSALFASWKFSTIWGISSEVNGGYPYLLKNVAPAGTLSIAGGASFTDTRGVQLDLVAYDANGNLAEMCFSDDNTHWSAWEAYSSTKFYSLSANNGSKTVYVKFRDSFGSESSTYSDSIELILPNMESSSGSSNYAGNSPVTVDPGLLIDGVTLNGARVMIENLNTGDVLSYTGILPGGVTASWNGTTGLLTFSGTASVDDYQALLRTVTFSSSSTVVTPRNITFSMGKAIPSDNGHYYEFVTGSYTWTDAFADSTTRSYFGMQGYLATIIGSSENELIRQRLQADAWIGASDDFSRINASLLSLQYANQALSEGQWYWVSGPEAGTLFSIGNGSPVAQPGCYINWNGLEPNNSGENEHYGEIYSSGSSGRWNDLPNSSRLGYIVEYGGMPDDPELQLSSSKTVSISAYHITYNENCSNLTSGIPPMDTTDYAYQSSATVMGNIGGLERQGYSFTGWNTQPDGEGTDYPADGTGTIILDSDITLYAQWTVKQYTLTYTAGSHGSINGNSSQTINHGSAGITVSAVPDEGYHFVSWSDGLLTANRLDSGITGNLSVTATFAINHYTVVFDSQGGSPQSSSASVEHGQKVNKPDTPSKNGYTFTGWYKEESPTEEWDFDSDTVQGDTTLYAKWVNLRPSGSMAINDGDAVTTRDAIVLHISASDPEGDPITQMSFSEDNLHWSLWETYVSPAPYTLSPGDGMRTVFAKLKDLYGNESEPFSASILLDAEIPCISGVSDGGKYHTSVTPTFNNSTAYLSINGGTPALFESNTVIEEEGNYSLELTDLEGNSIVLYFMIDKTAPQGTLDINTGESVTTADSFTLNITASDMGGSGLSQMRFSNDGTSWYSWEAYSDVKEWVPSAYGPVTVYMQLMDEAGNMSQILSDTIEHKSIPGSGNTIKNGFEDQIILFTASDFEFNNADGSPLVKVMILSLPSNGLLKINGTDATQLQEIELTDLENLMFTPFSDWNGSTSFTWKGSDGSNYSLNTATVSIVVSPVNDVPAAFDGSLTVNAGESRSGVLTASDSDSDFLSFSILVQGAKGTVTINHEGTGAYTYVPDTGSKGDDSFTFRVSDGQSDSNTATILVSIVPSGEADLSSLGISSGSLSPAFSANTKYYSVSVENSTSQLTLTPIAKDSGATIEINDSPLLAASKNILLSLGVNVITIKVTAQDEIISKVYRITVYRASPADDSSDEESVPPAVVPVGIGTSSTVTEEGQTTTTIKVDESKLDEKLKNSAPQTVVTLPFINEATSYVGELNGQMVKRLEEKQAIIEVKTASSTYTLPAEEIDIEGVSKKLGANVPLTEIKVRVEISEPSPETVKIVENASDQGKFTLVVPAVEFTVSFTYQERTASISSFNSYVERTIAIPEGIDPLKITTGVVVDPDGTVRHVPTQVIIIDSKYYASINSLTNSTYTVIWNPVEYADVRNHWAEQAVNDMASRMILSGNDQGLFEPERGMTRGEFAAVIVRALGLKPGEGTHPFRDVKDSDWYSDYIKTAYRYGILSGYGDGSFGPTDMITREQAITIIARAMQITGLMPDLTSDEVAEMLATLKDASDISDYARNPVATCLKTEVVSGGSNRYVAPKNQITRAEVAALVSKLLQKSGLI